MADTPAQQAAAGVLDDVLGDAAQGGQEDSGPEFGDLAPVDGPLFPVEQANEATVEVEQPQDDLEIPEIAWETPEDLQELLDAPDFDEEEEVAEFEQEGNPNYETEYEDPEKAALQRKIAKLEKKAAWAEEQKVKASRKMWEAEARMYFQFSNPDMIEAKSRRAFLKQAQAQHDAVAKVAKPVFDQLAELKAKAKADALAEARAEAEQRWGAPSSGPGTSQTYEDTQTMKRERLQHGRGLKDVLKARLKSGEVKL